MQVGSDAMRKMGGLAMEELQGYLALHVSFARVSPGPLANPVGTHQDWDRKP